MLWRRHAMLPVPLHHASKPLSKALVHGAPLISVLTTIAPLLWWTHTVPLEIDVNAGLSCVCEVASRYGVNGRDRVRGNRRLVETTEYRWRRRCERWHVLSRLRPLERCAALAACPFSKRRRRSQTAYGWRGPRSSCCTLAYPSAREETFAAFRVGHFLHIIGSS
jgi:hypothetical protein